MRVKDKTYRTVFVLGAGATRGAVGRVRVNGRMIRPPLNSDFFEVAAALGRAHGPNSVQARRVARLERAFKRDFGIKGGRPPMETAFGLLYMAKDLPKIYRSGPGPQQAPGHRREIDDFLSILFEVLLEVDRGSEETGYDRLASVLTPGDALITLNYDTALDSALVRHGWDPRDGYCLTGGRNKVSWSPNGAVGDVNLEDVKLLKLHGSANWWVRGSTANLRRVFDNKPVKVTAPRKNELREHMRQIIPPIYGKVFGHDHWRVLWEEAYDALCDAEALVVVGCSLADTDYHLPAFLKRVSSVRRRNGMFKRVFLVNSVKVRRKWQAVLRGSNRSSDIRGYRTFESFLSKELRI